LNGKIKAVSVRNAAFPHPLIGEFHVLNSIAPNVVQKWLADFKMISNHTGETMGKKIESLKQGQKIAFISSLLSFLLALMKGIIGYLFGSPILIADAFHSGADLLSHVASGFGLWLASRGKTTKFPYGLYRAETLACLTVGGFIVVAGFEIFMEGYHKLFHLEPLGSFPVLPVAASIISAVTAFVVAKMESKVGQSIGSKSLIANSREAFLDIFTSLVVLLGILLAYFRIPYVEGSVIILISLLLFKLGLENVWTSLLILLDANLDPELQLELEKKANEIYGVKGVSDIKIRQSGPFKMVECVIETRPSLSLYKAHELADQVENFIAQNYDQIESVFIHVEPQKIETLTAIAPVENIAGLDSSIHGHFARAPYFVILNLSDSSADIEDFYYNEFLGETQHLGVKIARVLVKYKIDLLFTFSIGEISYPILKDNLVDIYAAEEGHSVKEIIERYRLDQLQPLTGPTHPVEKSQVASRFKT
jgi:cation diffusion facilitator family transporter